MGLFQVHRLLLYRYENCSLRVPIREAVCLFFSSLVVIDSKIFDKIVAELMMRRILRRSDFFVGVNRNTGVT